MRHSANAPTLSFVVELLTSPLHERQLGLQRRAFPEVVLVPCALLRLVRGRAWSKAVQIPYVLPLRLSRRWALPEEIHIPCVLPLLVDYLPKVGWRTAFSPPH